MPGTRTGALSISKILTAKYGPDYYQRIGARGGAASNTGGFGTMTPEQRSAAGRKGGKASRRKFTDEERIAAGKRLLAGRLAKSNLQA
jgi:general stress protein YciG